MARFRWELEWQSKGYSVAAQLERDARLELPLWVQEEPVPDDGTRFSVESFWVLSTERAVGMCLGHIPESRIVAYAERKGLSGGSLGVFSAVIRALDGEYLNWAASRAKKAKEK